VQSFQALPGGHEFGFGEKSTHKVIALRRT